MPKSLITSGLPSIPAGASDDQARVLTPIYMALNALAQKMSEATGQLSYSEDEMAQINQAGTIISQNAVKIYLKATVALTFGQLCNILLDTGKLAARLADSTNNTRPAHCICNAPEGLAVGEFGEFILMTGYTSGISGTAIGTFYYLGTAGNSQAARPVAAGSIVQSVGIGLGSLGFYLDISSLFIQN